MVLFGHYYQKPPETESLTQNPDRQETRNYLLGTLTSDRKTQFEEMILSTPETYEELLLVEEELIDEYVSGGLSKLEREQFETHFLITAARQKNLRFGQLLKRYVSAHPFPVAPPDFNAAALPAIEEPAPAQNRVSPYLPFLKNIFEMFGVRKS